jgi:hypothetical protein
MDTWPVSVTTLAASGEPESCTGLCATATTAATASHNPKIRSERLMFYILPDVAPALTGDKSTPQSITKFVPQPDLRVFFFSNY